MRSGSSRRSQDQSTTARRVCWRGRTVRAPLVSWLLAAGSARMGRVAVRTVLVGIGVLAALTAVFASHGPLLLLATLGGVFGATGANAVLSTHAASSVPDAQRPTAIGLFTLCYQLGGAFGPAIATALVLGS
ncbi:hypothetical protein [Streptomyces sp. NPDC090036]|uniref:hypothetical protein n=1 Tax=Streptomyces sp. NPDC090036 TaxID=3365926 RepID=UPI003808EC18